MRAPRDLRKLAKQERDRLLDIVRHFGGREGSLPWWLYAAREESLTTRSAAILPESA